MNEFKSRREALGMTQKEIAEKLNIPKRTWQDWELEQRMPSDWVSALVFKAMDEMKEKQNDKVQSLGGLEAYTEAAVKFAEDSKDWPADVVNSLEFVTHRADGTYEETCDNGGEGGLDVSWAFKLSEEQVREKALQNFADEIAAIFQNVIEEAAADDCNQDEVAERIAFIKRYF